MVFNKQAFSALLFLCFAVAVLAGPTYASLEPAESSCDPLYYDTLESRAWLEAQREITQNQNLIFKPDSVLQYSCFDKQIGAVMKASEDWFSNQPSGSGPIGGSASIMIGAGSGSVLSGSGGTTSGPVDHFDEVAASAKRYVDQNFLNDPTKLLGGREVDRVTFDSPAVAAAYACDVMNDVWKEARCMSFIDEKDSDAFFTLKQYVDGDKDKRFKLGSCPKSANWQNEYDNLSPAETSWQEDDIETFFHLLDPDQCGGQGPLRTGVKILGSLNYESTTDEYFCILPGCYYNIGAGTCSSSF